MEPRTHEEGLLWLHLHRSSDISLRGGIAGSRMPVIEEAGVEFNKPTKQNCSPEREGGKKSLFGIHKEISDFFLSPLIIQVEKQFRLEGWR